MLTTEAEQVQFRDLIMSTGATMYREDEAGRGQNTSQHKQTNLTGSNQEEPRVHMKQRKNPEKHKEDTRKGTLE